MLTHLNDNYVIITAVDIENNDIRRREPYNPTFPIETLFHQIELAVEYATAGKRPYQDAQIVSRACLLVLRTFYILKLVVIGIKRRSRIKHGPYSRRTSLWGIAIYA